MLESRMMEEEEEVKWAQHYSSLHQILLVGEGDFSFSLSLAKAFGSAENIVATSRDSCDMLFKKYNKAQSNVKELMKLGATIIHEVDATKMKFQVGLRTRKFDKIVYNFPHAGFKGKEDNPQLIKLHRALVLGFFKNAAALLRPYGEIHVSHKTTFPFCRWNLEELASMSSLVLIERVDFCKADYPGYHNKRGDGSDCDKPFPLGECSTFKFVIGCIHKTKPALVPAPLSSPIIPIHFNYPTIAKPDLMIPEPLSRPIIPNYYNYPNNAAFDYPKTRIIPFERIPRSITIQPPRTSFQDLPFKPANIRPWGNNLTSLLEWELSISVGVSPRLVEVTRSIQRRMQHLEDSHNRRLVIRAQFEEEFQRRRCNLMLY